jgi:hypothetical protein
MKIKSAAAAAVLILTVAADALCGLLNGYYQISRLTLTYNDKDTQGFNNNNLYIMASDKRIRLVGAWRGYPLMRDAAIEKTVGDTLFLRDTQNPQSLFKFHIRNNTITGRHAIIDEDGSRQVIDSKATIRQLSQSEVERIKIIFSLP